MSKERRWFKRYTLELSGLVSLNQGENGPRLSREVDCRIVDFSRQGAGIRVSEVIIDKYHLFFAALESEDIVLHLDIELQNNGSPRLFSVNAQPVWFDRVLDSTSTKPFKMGVRFFKDLSEDDLRLLKSKATRSEQ